VEDPAHALELVEDVATLLFAVVGENREMAAAHLNPLLW
jgi:hypothetical protein